MEVAFINVHHFLFLSYDIIIIEIGWQDFLLDAQTTAMPVGGARTGNETNVYNNMLSCY